MHLFACENIIDSKNKNLKQKQISWKNVRKPDIFDSFNFNLRFPEKYYVTESDED